MLPRKCKQIATVLITLSAGLSLVRVTVLFVESWAAVRAERAGDAALLKICEQQTLASSDKFRNACRAARADSAAPVLLKTLMRSVNTAFNDFCEAFNTPTRLCLLVLFLLSGVSAPVVRAILTTLARGASVRDQDDDVDQENTRVVIIPSEYDHRTTPWARLRRRVRMQSTPRAVEVVSGDEDDFHECGYQSSDGTGWAPLSLLCGSANNGMHSKHL
jgi:hypothetical protein